MLVGRQSPIVLLSHAVWGQRPASWFHEGGSALDLAAKYFNDGCSTRLDLTVKYFQNAVLKTPDGCSTVVLQVGLG